MRERVIKALVKDEVHREVLEAAADFSGGSVSSYLRDLHHLAMVLRDKGILIPGRDAIRLLAIQVRLGLLEVKSDGNQG